MRRILRNLALALAVAAAIPPTMAWAAGQAITGNVSMNAAFTQAVTGVTNYNIPVTIPVNLSYANGTASNQVDTLYARQLTLAGAATTIDLTSLTDPAGNAISFARVREIIVQDLATTAGYDVKVEAGASNGVGWLPPSTSPVYARYSGTLRVSDPVSTGAGNGNVVDSTHKTVTFDPGANTVTINVVIAGGSAAFLPVVVLGLRRYRRVAA